MTLVTAMPVAAAARLVGEHDTRLWRVVQHYVETAVARMDLADLRRVAIDETAAKRGHNYITLFVDIDARKVVYVAEGRGADTVAKFADHVDDHNWDASRIKQVCIDMSPAYIKGVTDNLTEAEITFDKFHAVKLVNDFDPRMGSHSEPEAAQTPFRDMPMRQGEIRGSWPADSDRLLLLHELPRSRTPVRGASFRAGRARSRQWIRL